MLWEPSNPKDALRERFGFTDLDAAAEWTSSELSKNWNIKVYDCPRLAISDHNAIIWVDSDRGPLVVKWSNDSGRFFRLDEAAAVMRSISQLGIPVSPPLETKCGKSRTILRAPSCMLSTMVLNEEEGRWLNTESSSDVRLAGVCLAKLHYALTKIGFDTPNLARASNADLRGVISKWLSASDHGLVPELSMRLSKQLELLPDLPDTQQLIHNDFRSANILTKDYRISSVLDFDEMTVGYRICDLAKASTYLGTLFTNWGPTPITAQLALKEGYESVRPLGPEENQWFQVLLLWNGLAAIPGKANTSEWTAALSN